MGKVAASKVTPALKRGSFSLKTDMKSPAYGKSKGMGKGKC